MSSGIFDHFGVAFHGLEVLCSQLFDYSSTSTSTPKFARILLGKMYSNIQNKTSDLGGPGSRLGFAPCQKCRLPGGHLEAD